MKLSTREMVLAGVFTALACCFAVVFRLVQPALVPYSLLPMAALLAGGLLPRRVALASMTAYALIGLAGIPVFAAPPFGGLIYIFKPTFGFILGFCLAAYLVAWLLERTGRTWISYLAASIAGILAIYLVGLPYLYFILKFYLGQTVNVFRVLQIGFWPFIGLDLLKAVLAALILHRAGRIITPESEQIGITS